MSTVSRTDRQVSLLITIGSAVLILGAVLPAFVEQRAGFDLWWNAAGVLCAIGFVAMALAGWWLPSAVLRMLWVVLPATVIALQLLSFTAYRGSEPVVPWVWQLEPTAVAMLVLVLRPALAVATSLVAGCTVAVSAWIFTGEVPLDVAAATPIHLSNLAFVVIFIGIRAALTRFRTAEQDARAAAESSARAAAHAAGQEEFGRFVHDEVLSVMNAALLFHGDPPEVLRNEAGNALAVLSESRATSDAAPTSPGEVPRLLRARVARFVRGAEWSIDVSGPPIPGHVVAQIADASSEAARNVAVHAQATTVEVDVLVRDGRIRVIVRDDGRGFDAQSMNEGRMGVQSSIIARMEGVSGLGTVTSTVGVGTEVVMSWTP
ncbi:sensor histidine kinase [Microbacterium phyllosphaerae]|uniref:sensor histidine kinase n=1 Tax=Microbacterium phyllosphaerae TaxID=124798 RepID=UPI003D6614D5